MKIGLIHTGKAFLPEIEAYQRFFSGYGITCMVTTREDRHQFTRDVDWFLMGTDLSSRQPGIVRIHEYASVSVAPARILKDWMKRHFNARPDFRLFLNTYVKDALAFRDEVPSGLRNMGIADEWLISPEEVYSKIYDFIYIGDLSPARKPQLLIDPFTQPGMQQYSLLLVSNNYTHLQQQYASHSNVVFKGPVAHSQVKALVQQARFAINYIPDQEPYNRLTSTKFLEYAACGIPVISSNYVWIKEFQRQYGGNYFYLMPDLSNLTWDSVTNFRYSFPDLSSWTWEQQIRRSGALEFLQSRFPDLTF